MGEGVIEGGKHQLAASHRPPSGDLLASQAYDLIGN